MPTATNGLTQRHGYCFEVDPYDQAANRDPRPVKALGRFAHDPAAVGRILDETLEGALACPAA